MIRCPGHCVTTTVWCDIMTWALSRLKEACIVPTINHGGVKNTFLIVYVQMGWIGENCSYKQKIMHHFVQPDVKVIGRNVCQQDNDLKNTYTANLV